MPIRTFLALIATATGAGAQQPLSAIDWLTQEPPAGLPGIVLMEPPVTKSARLPEIEVSPLESVAPPLGLVSSRVTGLPVDLWRGSDVEDLAEQIKNVPVRNSAAMQKLLFTLLLSETTAPSTAGSSDALVLARIDRLLQLGAVDAAQALALAAGPTDSGAVFQRWLDATLLTGDEDRSCAALAAHPHLTQDYAARIFCTARRGDWQTAALTLETAHTLELLPSHKLDVLDRFLSPDVFEDAPPLPIPDTPDALTFRLHETIGERMSTATLPTAFATADLRDIAGWKAQIEAAERLTRLGALTPNQLLGLYSARKPAASGGVWDRAKAIQRFETALGTGSADAVARTLPTAWRAMQPERLEVAFAELFSADLGKLASTDAGTTDLIWRIRLLSESYRDAGRTPPDDTAETRMLAAIALGQSDRMTGVRGLDRAIADGFATDAEPPQHLRQMVNRGQLGAAILEAMALFDSGARGNGADLTDALSTMRLVGLEDTARRAALELLILDRR